MPAAHATLSADAWGEALALFERWCDLGAADRDVELARLQQRDATLHRRVAALLAGDRADTAELRLPPSTGAAGALAPLLQPGQRLGPWELRGCIGSGGMGEVWRASRCDGRYAADAAVKVVRGGGALADARFVREGELLARLSHPNIARLLDAGSADGGARYLVLEFVPGERLDRWCDARRLGIEARLALLLQLCDAVAYAHAHLVLHRDLKPGNVLVDADGRVKLLDFGVAKLLDENAPLPELTREGGAALTPEYAAPEQVRGSAVTTATDVYALGALLYRLLSGASPYGAQQRDPAALARCVVELPALPMRVQLDAAAAAARGLTVAQLRHALHGDLEAIAARALEKDPARRYANAAAFAADLRRHLALRPVAARPDDRRYRAAKFVRRHRAKLAVAALAAAALAAGLATAAWQWRAAAAEAARTQATLRVMTALFTQLSPEASVPVIEVLRRGWIEVQRGLHGDAALQGEVARPLGYMLAAAGDPSAARQALQVSRAHLEARGRSGSPDHQRVLLELGELAAQAGDAAGARSAYEQVLAAASGSSSEHALTARIRLGTLALDEGDLQAARRQLEAARTSALAQLGDGHRLHLLALDGLADVAREAGQWNEARRLYAAKLERLRDAPAPELLRARIDDANLEADLGDYSAAAAALGELAPRAEATWGPGDVKALYTNAWWAVALFHSGARERAEAVLEASLQQAADADAETRHTLQVIQARHRLRSDALDAAVAALQDSLRYFEGGEAAQRPAAERVRTLLAEAELRRGRIAEAQSLLAQVRQAQQQIYASGSHDQLLPALLVAFGRDAEFGAAEALPQYEAARAIARARLPAAHPERLRAEALADHAAWRADAKPERQTALQHSTHAYRAALDGRSDVAAARVLTEAVLAATTPQRLNLEQALALLAL